MRVRVCVRARACVPFHRLGQDCPPLHVSYFVVIDVLVLQHGLVPLLREVVFAAATRGRRRSGIDRFLRSKRLLASLASPFLLLKHESLDAVLVEVLQFSEQFLRRLRGLLLLAILARVLLPPLLLLPACAGDLLLALLPLLL